MTPPIPQSYQGNHEKLSNSHERSSGYLYSCWDSVSTSMKYWTERSTVANNDKQRSLTRFLKRILNITNGLILVWLFTLWWGERIVFKNSLAACQWHHWEQWPSEARPHHVVLIADPQLVDPHTYPDRSWPLSSLTIAISDLYLRRCYGYLLRYLQPDTLFFLGDLFDGGREWGTSHSSSPDDRYKSYGNKYWMKEYIRFQDIFVDGWQESNLGSAAEPRGRKMVASLPGNHDLGFASGVQLPVKERFETYFGNVNRLDIIGNHSFISVDTVSLSAMDQVDPNTGSSGVGDGTSHSVANRDIWGPTEDFLAAVRQARNRAVGREIRVLADLPEQLYHDPGLIGYAPNLTGLSEAGKSEHVVDLPAGITEKSFPSILLTHVPLYRAPDTDCGPQREGGHAIFVQGGYQYQNVLTPLISKDIVSKIGVEDIAQVYSGDDHDYCEIEHGEITGRIKEITIKSISMAMGVRRPGFLAVSLHNPVDMQLTANDESKDSAGVKKDTIQNHLCLLPDQISIFLRYAMLLGLSLVVLAIRALMVQYHTRSNNGASKSPLLPLTRENTQRPLNNEKLFRHGVSSSSSSSASPEHAISGRTTISTQRSQARSGSPCGLVGYGNLPAASRSSSPSKAGLDAAFAPARGANVISVDDHDDWGMPRAKRRADIFGQQQRRGMVMEFGHSVGRLAIPVLVFYLWLISRG